MIRLLIQLMLLFLGQHLLAQGIFHRSYGGEGNEFGRAVIECNTGGYLLVGSTNSYLDSSTDMYVLRLDEAGDYIWGRNIGVPNQIDWARDVKETQDGGFLIVGYTNATPNGDYDGTLTKIDSEGSLIWSHTYGQDNWDFLENMALDTNGEIYLAGQTTLTGNPVGWLIKTTVTGEILWEKHFPGNGSAQLTGVDVCESGNIVFTGYNYSVMMDLNTQISGVVTEDGNVNWVLGYPEFGNVTTQNCICDISNQIVVSGTINSDNSSAHYFSKINSNSGEVIWTQFDSFENINLGASINQLSNGRYLFSFNKVGIGYGMMDGSAQIRYQNGHWINAENSMVFGGTENDYFHCIIPTQDGGYAAAGETLSFGNNNQVFLVKVNANNDIDITNEDFLDIATDSKENHIKYWGKPWPNPAQDVLHLKNNMANSSNTPYVIHSTSGIEVQSGILEQKNGNATINVTNIQSGTYVLTITSKSGTAYSYKIIKAP